MWKTMESRELGFEKPFLKKQKSYHIPHKNIIIDFKGKTSAYPTYIHT